MSNPVHYDFETKTWSGPSVSYPFGNASVGELIYDNLKANLSHVAQISDDSGIVYTNERMLRESISFANFLRSKGIKKGETALMLLHNHHYMAPTWLGCVFAGVIISPFALNDYSVKDEISELVKQLNPSLMVTSYLDDVKWFQEVFMQLNMDCPIYIYENELDGCHDLRGLLETQVNIDDFKPEPIVDPDSDIFLVTLSSATTTKPKLINVTHKQFLLGSADQLSNVTIATTLTPGWQTESVVVFQSLHKNHKRIIRAFYTTDEFLLLLEKYKVMLTFLKPKDMFSMVHSELIKSVDLSELIFAVCFGEHLTTKVAEQFEKYLPAGMVVSLFGMSEFGMSVADISDLEERAPNLVGKVKRNIHFRVRGDTGEYLGPNEMGELCVKADASFSGYYGEKGSVKAMLTDEGYFPTGDLGYLDEHGNIFLIDRRKYCFSYRGQVVTQTQVELIISENIEGVAAVCVVDIEHKEHGLIPIIVIVPHENRELEEKEIIQTVMKHHPFEFQTQVHFFDKLPMTISGKVKKHLVRELISQKFKH